MTKNQEIAPIRYPEKAVGQLGPKMQALTPRQRAFVIAMLETGQDNHTLCAEMAGYSTRSREGLRVTAFHLAHDEKIQAAIQEQAGRRMKAGAIMASGTLLAIANNPVHKDQLKAAVEILNRSGLHAISETKVTHEHSLDDRAMVARIVDLAKQQGLDPRKLLGSHGVVLDAQFEEIEREADEKQARAVVDEFVEQEAEPDATGLEDLL